MSTISSVTNACIFCTHNYFHAHACTCMCKVATCVNLQILFACHTCGSFNLCDLYCIFNQILLQYFRYVFSTQYSPHQMAFHVLYPPCNIFQINFRYFQPNIILSSWDILYFILPCCDTSYFRYFYTITTHLQYFKIRYFQPNTLPLRYFTLRSHLLGNGHVERFKHTLESILAKTIGQLDSQLHKALYADRTAIHDTYYRFHFISLKFCSLSTAPVGVIIHQPNYILTQNLFKKLTDTMTASCSITQQHCGHSIYATNDYTINSIPQYHSALVIYILIGSIKQQYKKVHIFLERPSYNHRQMGDVNYKIQLIGGAQTFAVHSYSSATPHC